jgi:hypothetical protein
MVIMPSTEPKFRRFKPVQVLWSFKGYKIHSTTVFGAEVKPSAHVKILKHAKDPLSYV